ncbi:tetratricopeptide repeat protein [bacterium]|nr:tetratricopeptide repeat protein [bacterium]
MNLFKSISLVISSLLLIHLGCTAFAVEFQVLRPAKLNIPRNIKKVFIDPDLFKDTDDKLKIKTEVVVALKRKLSDLGRFEAIIGPPRGYDPNREVVGIIQGDIISGGEIDEGQFTEKAECKGSISGLVGAATAKNTTQQGLTVSRRHMLCKLPNLQSKLVESGVTAGLGMLGVTEHPRLDEVIRVYKYKNLSLFAQLNLSFTQLGSERETLAIRADAASFSRHVIDPDTFHNIRESGDNANLIWLWFNITPVAPVINKDIAIVSESNPGSYRGKRYSRIAPDIQNLPDDEKQKIILQLVNNTTAEFLKTISPYKAKIVAEIASGGNDKVEEKLEKGRYQEVKNILKGSKEPDDLYNLGLAYEATASTIEDYEDALYYYSQALDKSPGTRLYAQGIGRMEFQLRVANRLKKQTAN